MQKAKLLLPQLLLTQDDFPDEFPMLACSCLVDRVLCSRGNPLKGLLLALQPLRLDMHSQNTAGDRVWGV